MRSTIILLILSAFLIFLVTAQSMYGYPLLSSSSNKSNQQVATVYLCQQLPVPEIIQEQDNWCWATCSKALLQYYGNLVYQCAIADFARTANNWGNDNCCSNPSGAICNQPNYLYGTDGSIQGILQHFGEVSSSGLDTHLVQSEIESEIAKNAAFVIRWLWDYGDGHHVVCRGICGDNIYYMDPWYNYGYEVAAYSWVVQGSGHTWTHTLITDKPLPAPSNCFASPDRCDGIYLTWDFSGSWQTGFKIRRDGSLIYTGIDPNERDWLDSGCSVGNHIYTIYAYNASEDGPVCSPSGTRVQPDFLSDCEASTDRWDGIYLSWSYSGSGHIGFKVNRDGSRVHTGTDPSERAWLDTTCSVGDHNYTIWAYDICGDGPPCDASGARPCSPPLAAPTLLGPPSNIPQPWCGNLTWSSVPNATGYKIQIGRICGTGQELEVSLTQFGYMMPGGKCYWRVKTKNACDIYGSYSPCDSFIAVPDPKAPDNFFASKNRTDGIHLTWDWSGTGHIGFKIRRDGNLIYTGTDPNQREWLDNDSGCTTGDHYYSIWAYNDCISACDNYIICDFNSGSYCGTKHDTCWLDAGAIGLGLHSDSGYVEYWDDDLFSQNNLSIEFQVMFTKLPVSGNASGLVTKYQNGNAAESEWGVFLEKQAKWMLTGNGTNYIASDINVVKKDSLYSVRAILIDDYGEIWVDNELVASGEIIRNFNNTNTPVVFGNSDTHDNNFYGMIDEIRIGCIDGPSSSALGTRIEQPIATLLLNHTAYLEESDITIKWTLSFLPDNMQYLIFRAKDNDVIFDELYSTEIIKDGYTFTFHDRTTEPGSTYKYQVILLSETEHQVLFVTNPIAVRALPLTLFQNYPNPLNPITSISFYLPYACHVTLEIYDSSGKLVTRLLNREQKIRGRHQIEWCGLDARGSPVSSGVYYYRIITDKVTISKKMVLLK